MKVLINGVWYDSLQTPILLAFDNEWEQKTFGMSRFVSAPEESTVEERQAFIDTVFVSPLPIIRQGQVL